MHYSLEELAEYFSGDMNDSDAAALEIHLGECAACMSEAGELSSRGLQVEQWSASAHQNAYAEAQIAAGVAALAAAGNITPAAAIHYAAWKRLGGLVATEVIPIRAQRHRLELSVEQFAHVTSGGFSLDVSSDAMTLGGTAPSPSTSARPGSGPAHLSLTSPATDVVVRVSQLPATAGIIAALIPLSADLQPLAQELRHQPDASWAVTFHNVRPGEYVLAVEPSQALS